MKPGTCAGFLPHVAICERFVLIPSSRGATIPWVVKNVTRRKRSFVTYAEWKNQEVNTVSNGKDVITIECGVAEVVRLSHATSVGKQQRD